MDNVIPFVNPREQLAQSLEEFDMDLLQLRQDYKIGEVKQGVINLIEGWRCKSGNGHKMVGQDAREAAYKITLVPEQDGNPESISYQLVEDLEQLVKPFYDQTFQITMAPSAIKRVIEPIISICGADGHIEKSRDQKYTDVKIIRAGIRTAAALGIAQCIFTEQVSVGDTNSEAKVEALAESSGIVPENLDHSLEIEALRFAGAVALNFCAQELSKEFETDNAGIPQDKVMMNMIMLKALAKSRRQVRGNSNKEAGVTSYALESAYTQAQMKNIIPLWFRSK